MARVKKVSQEPTLLDLYAAFALMGLLQKTEVSELPAFIAHKSFEIAKEMLDKREEILGGETKDE